jgi:hypothetical protein
MRDYFSYCHGCFLVVALLFPGAIFFCSTYPLPRIKNAPTAIKTGDGQPITIMHRWKQRPQIVFFINNLFLEGYLIWHLFQVCIDFFGQLITQPRSMPGTGTLLRPRIAGLAALHPRHVNRLGRVCFVLSLSFLSVQLCYARLSRQCYPAQGKGRIK